MTLKFAKIGRDDVQTCRLLIYIPQSNMNLPSDYTSETATGLHGPSVFASLDSTHFHTNCLIKTLPSQKLIKRVNDGSSSFFCLKLDQVTSEMKPAWKVAPHLNYKDKKKMVFKYYKRPLKSANANVHYHAIEITCMTHSAKT